jgi:predicted transcriptional regulator
MKAMTIKLPDALDLQLTHFVHAHSGMSKSAVVRQAIEFYLSMAPQGPAQSASVAARKWAGTLSGPADLASNPAHLDDFGR